MSDKNARLNAAADKAAEIAVELRLLAREEPVPEPEKPDQPEKPDEPEKPEPEKPDEPPVEPEKPPPVPEDPNAILVARFTHAVQGLTVNVDRTISKRPDGGGRTFWDFGDGSGERQGLARDTHTYKQPGTYPITLRLDANAHAGLTHSVTHDVTVAGEAEDPTDPELPGDPVDEDDPEAPPVVLPPIPPPPVVPAPPTPQDTPNEPAGYKLITNRHFRTSHSRWNTPTQQYPKPGDSHLAEGWSTTEGKFPNFSIVDDPTAPSGDGKVAQMRYPAGMRSGVGPASSTIYMPPGLREVYIAIWMKLSKNWIGNTSNVNKMFFFGVSGGNNQFIFIAWGRGAGPLQAYPYVQGTLDDDAHGSLHRPNLGKPSPVKRGQWQRFEFILRCGSALGKADGSMEMWNDGVKVFQEFDTNWTQRKHPTKPLNMNVFNWNPTYGGGDQGIPYNDKPFDFTTDKGELVTTPSRKVIASAGAAPDFAIDPNSDDQWQRMDRVYLSGR